MTELESLQAIAWHIKQIAINQVIWGAAFSCLLAIIAYRIK